MSSPIIGREVLEDDYFYFIIIDELRIALAPALLFIIELLSDTRLLPPPRADGHIPYAHTVTIFFFCRFADLLFDDAWKRPRRLSVCR